MQDHRNADRRADAFYRDCGDLYVNAVRYGSSLYVMLTYETQDEDTANSLKAKLAGSGASGVVNVDASVETTLVNTASSGEARVTMTVKAAGAGSNATISVPICSPRA